MTNIINIEEIKEKLYAKLKLSGWSTKLRGFIYSPEFDKIIQHLISESQKNNKFTPAFKNIFNVFEKCKFEDLKVIIVNDSCYERLHDADGLAFSCDRLTTELETIFKAIDGSVYNWNIETTDTNLERWVEQGVLLLNLSLTTSVGTKNKHEQVWKPFISYLFEVLNETNTGLIYVFMGKKAARWDSEIGTTNYRFFVPHPLTTLYNSEWKHDDVFIKISAILKDQYNYLIKW